MRGVRGLGCIAKWTNYTVYGDWGIYYLKPGHFLSNYKSHIYLAHDAGEGR